MVKDATKIMKRNPNNPVINVDDYPNLSQIYNPTGVKFGDETIVVASVVEHAGAGYGGGIGQTWIARSKDGVHFDLKQENFVKVGEDMYEGADFSHFIDNRVTKMGDTYYFLTPVDCTGYAGPVAILGKTKDFEKYEAISIITPPRHRGASLFPEKINGKYYMLDRPSTDDPRVRGEIWMAASKDMIHWGEFRPVLAPGYRYWNTVKIGPTPPLKTSKGWLEIIHGVAEPEGSRSYNIGAILLDLEEPWKIIGRTNSPLITPEDRFEQHGMSDNSPFVCGAFADEEKDTLTMYYGACDKYICLAEGKLSEVIDACINGL